MRPGRPQVVAELGQRVERAVGGRQRRGRVDRRLLLIDAQALAFHQRAGVEDRVGEPLARANGLVGDRGRPRERPRREERRRQRRQQLRALELRLDRHPDRPLEQADLAGEIAEPVRERGRSGHRPPGAKAQLGGLRGADLVQAPVRRLELVADPGLRAGRPVGEAGEPARMPLVQAGAGGLGE